MTARTIHVIYVPGLGDRYDGFRRFALKFWNIWGVSTELVPSIWNDGNDLQTKSHKVKVAIKKAHAAGSQVVLVGESAGAALALNVAAVCQVEKVITLCGVATANTPIAASIRKRAPALDEAVRALNKIVITWPVISLHAFFDGVVGKRYSTAHNAESHVIWSVGHLSSIVLCLTLYSPYIISLIRRAPNSVI